MLANTTDLSRSTRTIGGGRPETRTVRELEPISAHLRFVELGGGATDQVTTMNLGYHRQDGGSLLDHTIAARSHRHDGDATVRAGSSTENFRALSPGDCFHRELRTVDGWITADTAGC